MRVHGILMRVRLLTSIERESTVLYTCCQEIQEPWPLAPKLGAKPGRQAVPRLWDTFNKFDFPYYDRRNDLASGDLCNDGNSHGK
jgi:hypothetical protein